MIGLHTAAGGPGRRGAAARRRCPRARSCSGPPPAWPRSACGCSARPTGVASRCSSARGNNGGDALFAGAALARRGRPGDRRPARPRPGARRRAWPRCAGPAAACSPPRPRGDRRSSTAPTWCSTACSASAAAAGCAPTAAGAGPGGRGRAPASPSPSTSPAGSTPTPAPSTGAAFPAHAHRHLRRGQARPGRRGRAAAHAGQVHLVDIGLGPHLPPPTAFQLTDADVAARLPPPSAGRRQVLAGRRRRRRRARRPTPAPACCAPAPRCAPGRASSATPGRRPTACGPPGRRRSSPTAGRRTPAGCRPGWSAPAWAPTTPPAACWPRCWPPTCRWSSTPTR